MNHELRPYQTDCIDRILEDEHETTLANLFCGLGKSLIMAELLFRRFNEGIQFVVMPNLSLVRQFCANYLEKRRARYMVFCSLEDTDGINEATTDEAEALKFVQGGDGTIATTYQSLEKLVRSVEGQVVSCAIFDESHHLQREKNEWALTCPAFKRRLLFSATPSPNNGVPVFTYSYAEALENEDDWGQPLPYSQDVRLHVGTFDGSAGAVAPHDNIELLINTALKTENMRCLSFHSNVNGDDPDSVKNFAQRCKDHLPIIAPGIKWRVETLDAATNPRDRVRILAEFDATPDNEIFILCSCETISEGVDTKRCNLVAFITPVRSYYKIVQKFGRAVRLQPHDRPATILLPFWVDPAQFTDTMTKEERDAVPRTIYAKGNPLFDFYAAVREGDPELLELFQNMYRGPQTKRLKHYAELCGDRPRLSWEEAVQEATGVESDDIAMAARESNTTVEVHPRDGPVEQHEGAAAVEKSIVEMEKDRFVVVPKVVAPAPRENRVVYDSCSPVLMNVNFNNALGTAVLEYELRPEHFEQRVQELKVFYEKYGEPRQSGKRGNERSLALWMCSRRMDKKKNNLTAENIQRIEMELKWWSWDPLKDTFEKNIRDLRDFHSEHGEPKQRGKHDNEDNMARWINRRRVQKRMGKLTTDIIQRIEAEFDWWSWEPHADAFEQNIEDLKIFYSEHGEPKNDGIRNNEDSLAVWIGSRRKDKKMGKLTTEIIQRIESEFDWWSWEPNTDAYEKTIQDLKIFYDEHGEPKRTGKRDNEESLSAWITRRRVLKKSGKLSTDMIHRIESEFEWWSWDPQTDAFEKTINDLKIFHDKYGEPKYGGNRSNENSLATWIGTRRDDKKNGKLTTEIVERIEMEFDWWRWAPHIHTFEKTIQDLKLFYSNHGKPKRNGKHNNEDSLASWIKSRRLDKKKGKLSCEKISLIEKEFPWWTWWGTTSDAASASMDEDTASITEDGADASLDSLEFAPTAEQDPPEERREKRPRDDGLDGMDKDALISMIREQKRSREGYNAPNPVNKDEINALFSRSLPRHRGAVLFLDHTDFKTARALQSTGVEPRDMIIPQRDRATYDAMRRDPVFGTSVILGDFNGILSQHTMPVRGIYADFTGPLKEAEEFIEACRRIHFVPHAVVAVTITLRNPEGGAEHVNQDIVKLSGMLNRELDTIAIDDPETGKTIWSLAYGHGAPMATVIQRRRN